MTTPAGPEPAWVRLRVRGADGARSFYGDLLGLGVEEEGREMRLTPPGGKAPVLVVDPEPGAPLPAPSSAGLFHLALRVPGREDLARLLRRLGNRGVRLQGAADHGVSEALYLADPEGNGVELYVDRPRDTWTWRAEEIRMTTLPLDVEGLLAAAEGEAGVPTGTTLGHVHLRTTDLEAAEAFWVGEVGLEVTTRAWPGARFLASGGYHHHLGLNTWGGPLERRPPGTAGLVETGWRVPGQPEREALRDPDGHRVVLVPSV